MRRDLTARMSAAERKRMQLAGAAWETRTYLLLHCRSSPQALRLASALAAVADMLWPTTTDAEPAQQSAQQRRARSNGGVET